MRASLDVATDPWGIKVNRVELKNINSTGSDPGCNGETDESRNVKDVKLFSVQKVKKNLLSLLQKVKKNL